MLLVLLERGTLDDVDDGVQGGLKGSGGLGQLPGGAGGV